MDCSKDVLGFTVGQLVSNLYDCSKIQEFYLNHNTPLRPFIKDNGILLVKFANVLIEGLLLKFTELAVEMISTKCC